MNNPHDSNFVSWTAIGGGRCRDRVTPSVLVCAQHNRRSGQHVARSNIDPTRSHLNECLHGGGTPAEIVKRHTERLALTTKPVRKGSSTAIEIVFSPPNDKATTEFFEACLQWTAANFGGRENILSFDIHNDEAIPHAHVLATALTDGIVSARRIIGRRDLTQALRKRFDADVGARFGLPALSAFDHQARTNLAQRVIAYMTDSDHPATADVALWVTIQQCIAEHPKRFATALRLPILSGFVDSETASSPPSTLTFAKPELLSCVALSENCRKPPSTLGNGSIPKAKRVKTFVEIMTGRGKRTVEDANAKRTRSHNPVCDVSQAVSGTGHSEKNDVSGTSFTDTIRVRDSDFASQSFDPETGEFVEAPIRPQLQKLTAAKWVSDELALRSVGVG
jgi:hypothetical protein